MASLAPRPSLLKLLFEPLGGLQLVGAAILVWLAGPVIAMAINAC